MTHSLLIDDTQPGVRVVTLNRPERMNALDGPTLAALNDAVRTAADPARDIRVIVIRGTGRAFCAGNDLKWLASGVLADPAAHMRHQDLMQDTFAAMEGARQIVIASVNGYAVAGGFELAPSVRAAQHGLNGAARAASRFSVAHARRVGALRRFGAAGRGARMALSAARCSRFSTRKSISARTFAGICSRDGVYR
ncbi:putative enoyl-CoA hydratase/isomerase [Burkholderia lata]|nr:putative enoyl-CoA hydratase/isomerase [Burkholderia lata]